LANVLATRGDIGPGWHIAFYHRSPFPTRRQVVEHEATHRPRHPRRQHLECDGAPRQAVGGHLRRAAHRGARPDLDDQTMPVATIPVSFSTRNGIVMHTTCVKAGTDVSPCTRNITPCAFLSGGDATHLPARPHGTEEAPACGGPDSEVVFARGTNGPKTSSSSTGRACPVAKRTEPNQLLQAIAPKVNRSNPAPRTNY
jgi:hypothetical protein